MFRMKSGHYLKYFQINLGGLGRVGWGLGGLGRRGPGMGGLGRGGDPKHFVIENEY
jgi:hypothetical protein